MRALCGHRPPVEMVKTEDGRYYCPRCLDVTDPRVAAFVEWAKAQPRAKHP